MNSPTLRHFNFFLSLAEEQNFSLAAEKCFVTQPTLSIAIKEMEVILGHELFNRGKRTITLTAIGAEFLPHIKDILTQTENLVSMAKQATAPMSGPMRMGIIPTIAPYMLPSIFQTIQNTYPDLKLQIFEDQSARLVEQLDQGKLDLIMLAFPFDTPSATQKILFEEPFYLATPKDHTIDKSNIDVADLEPGELLLLAEGHCLTDHALSACSLQKPSQRKAYSASSLTTLIQMVSHGYGMTLLPEMVVTGKNRPDTINIYPFKSPKPTRQIGLAWSKNTSREADFLKLAALMM